MATKKTPTVDTTDVAGAKALALWCRSERIVIAELQVGSVRLVMQDLGLAGSLAPPNPATDEQLRANFMQRMGGPLFEAATGAPEDPRPEYDGGDEGDD